MQVRGPSPEDEYEDIPPRVSQEEWIRKYAPPG
jgi:hypothetical protein